MKKLLFVLLFMLSASLSFCRDEAQGKATLCDVSINTAFKANECTAHVYYNSAGDGAFHVMTDADGGKMKFPSYIDVIDYMMKQKWQLLTSYTESGKLHFVFKKGQ